MSEHLWGWAILFVDIGEIAIRPEHYQFPHTARRGLKAYLQRLMGIAYNPNDEIRFWIFRGDFDAAGGMNFLVSQPKVEIAYSKL